jgi:large subunit ribosomal protein L3
MSIGLVGRKCGMTRIFNEDGSSTPVTVLEINSNRITQIKNIKRDGYRAIQVAVGDKKSSKMNKAMAGHYAVANVVSGRALIEFKLENEEGENLTTGFELTIDIFTEGQFIDVQATSIGKGYAGGIKRYNFKMQDATHGNSISHRSLGSIGQCQTPGRVFKGKKMAGHLGAVKTTIQNLVIHSIDQEKKLLLVKGAVPGSKGGDVVITTAIKKRNRGNN